MRKHVVAAALCVIACRGRVHHGIDAGPTDAAIDALSPVTGDPPANATKLVISRDGAPAMAAVIFQDADMNVVSAVLTNEQGVAWAVMPAGGFVTAIEHVGSGTDELTTFAAVEQAETLTLALGNAGPQVYTPLSVTVPADSNASGYQLYSSCGGPAGVAPGVFTDVQLVGCGTLANLLVVSLDANADPQSTLYAPDTALPTGPLATDATSYPTLSIAGAYGGFATATFTYVGVPSMVSYVETYQAIADARGRVFDRTAGAAPSGGGANVTITMPAVTAPTLTATTGYTTSEIGQQLIYEERAAGAGAYSLDLAAAMLPAYNTPPAYDAAARAVTWSERPAAVTADVVRTRLSMYRDDIPAGRAWTWRMIAPRSATRVVYPQLPSFGFDFTPSGTDTIVIDELTTASVPGGYAAVRADGFGDLTHAVMSAPGRMVVELLAPPQL